MLRGFQNISVSSVHILINLMQLANNEKHKKKVSIKINNNKGYNKNAIHVNDSK